MTSARTEQELLEGLATDDDGAIAYVYKQNFDLILKMIHNNSGTYDDARDIFQEAMLVLYDKSKQPDFRLTCKIPTFLYSVSRRLWLKKLQRGNRYVTTDEGLEDTVPVDDVMEEKEKLDADFELMESAMLGLGEPCKSLLEAYYFEKKQMAEIAEDFGYTNADNAKNQKYKCLMRLKKLFFAQYKNV